MAKLDYMAKLDALGALAKTMAEAVVQDPRQVTTAAKFEADCLQIQVSAPEDAQGRLVGQGGQTIRALRTIVKAAAARYGVRCELNVGPYASAEGRE